MKWVCFADENIFSSRNLFFSQKPPKKRLTEPARPTIPLSRDAAVAQLDRATGYEPVGQEFESLQPHQKFEGLGCKNLSPFFILKNVFNYDQEKEYFRYWCEIYGINWYNLYLLYKPYLYDSHLINSILYTDSSTFKMRYFAILLQSIQLYLTI